MNRTTALAALATLCLYATSAHAIDAYVGAGTTGFLLGVEHHYNDNLGVRADLNALSLSRDASDSSATYHGTLHLADVAVLADYHPWGGRFRLSAGALMGNSNFSAVADGNASGTFNLNGIAVNAAGQSLAAKVTFPTVRPYFGLGFGSAARDTGLSFNGDVGVAIGRPKVTINASPGLVTAAQAAGTSVEAETTQLQSKADQLRLYPVIRLGVGWGF